MHEVQNLSNRLKFQRTICLKKRNPLGATCENLLELSAHLIELYRRLIDSNRTIRGNLNDDRIGWIVGEQAVCLLWYGRLKPLLVRNDHENDQQHQKNINQRDHIHIGNDPAPVRNNAHSHESPREAKFPCEEDSHNPA